MERVALVDLDAVTRLSQGFGRGGRSQEAAAHLGIPDSDGKWPALYGLEKYGLGPSPLADDKEEFVDYDRCGGFGIELTDASDEHGPCNTTRESHDIGIYSATLRPELDGTECELESALLRDEGEDLVGDTGAIEGAKLCLVETSQQTRVSQIIEIRGQLLLDDSGEDQVNADPRVLELDDGHECIRDNCQVGNGALWGHRDQKIREVLEVVFAGDIFRGDDEGIDVGAGAKDAESEAAVGEDLAVSTADEDFVLGLLFLGDLANKLVADLLKRVENRMPSKSRVSARWLCAGGRKSLPLLCVGLALKGLLAAQFFDEGVARPILGIGGQIHRDRRRNAVDLLAGHVGLRSRAIAGFSGLARRVSRAECSPPTASKACAGQPSRTACG